MQPIVLSTFKCPACGSLFPSEEAAQNHINESLEREELKHVEAAKAAQP